MGVERTLRWFAVGCLLFSAVLALFVLGGKEWEAPAYLMFLFVGLLGVFLELGLRAQAERIARLEKEFAKRG